MPINNYMPGYYPIVQGTMPQMTQNTQSQWVNQNMGFVRVQNEDQARMYPVPPGNSITFIDENAPYCYTKTMDFSQLDRPKFEKYRLVKEEDRPETGENGSKIDSKPQEVDLSVYALKSDLESFRDEVRAIRDSIESITITKKAPIRAKKEADE